MPNETYPEPDQPAAEAGAVIIVAGRRYLTTKELALKFGKSDRTVQRWEERRVGPPCVQILGMKLYPEDLLPGWLDSHQRKPARQPRRRRGGGDVHPTA